MQFYAKETACEEITALKKTLEDVIKGLDLEIVELVVSRHKGSAQVRLVIYNGGNIGHSDCSRAHHAVMPRLEAAFPGQDVYLEVSSAGINRQIKDGLELSRYKGRGIRCYRTDISDWTAGILEKADEKGIVLKGKEGKIMLDYEVVAKAKLDSSYAEDAAAYKTSKEEKIGN